MSSAFLNSTTVAILVFFNSDKISIDTPDVTITLNEKNRSRKSLEKWWEILVKAIYRTFHKTDPTSVDGFDKIPSERRGKYRDDFYFHIHMNELLLLRKEEEEDIFI